MVGGDDKGRAFRHQEGVNSHSLAGMAFPAGKRKSHGLFVAPLFSPVHRAVLCKVSQDRSPFSFSSCRNTTVVSSVFKTTTSAEAAGSAAILPAFNRSSVF